MHEPTTIPRQLLGARPWVDGFLLAGGASLAVAGSHVDVRLLLLGIAVAAVGLVAPLLRWRGSSRGVQDVVPLVPSELAERHRAVRAAAGLPGVVDGARVVRAADDAVLEVAALLAGRPPRTGSQRRLVDAHVRALAAAETDLVERHHAWVAAQAELDALEPEVPMAEQPPAARPGGVLVGLLVVVLLPAFLGWDLVRGAARAGLALGEGIVLRLATIGRLVVLMGSAVVALAARARGLWTGARDELVAATREAHDRVLAARLGLRVRLRRARSAAAGPRLR